MANTLAPDPGEVEVSLFGPGLGESIVIHIGYGKWIVVDSCRSAGRCVPLDYLNEIGVNVADDVLLVTATHAHDDHVRGLAELYRSAKAARLALPMAATKEEFAAILALDERQLDVRLRVLREYSQLLEELSTRPKTGQRLWYGLSNRTLVFQHEEGGIEAQLLALSPSDEDVLASQTDLAMYFPSAGDAPKRSLTRDPNHFAMALLLRCGSRAVLLASDVLTGNSGATGWSAIIVEHRQALASIELCKVAHHGSVTGHHDEVWHELSSGGVVSMMTPFLQGSVKLPKPEDVDRLKDLSTSLFITAREPTLSRSQKRLAASITGSSSGVRLAQGETGQVRARADALGQSAWRVDVVGHARQL